MTYVSYILLKIREGRENYGTCGHRQYREHDEEEYGTQKISQARHNRALGSTNGEDMHYSIPNENPIPLSGSISTDGNDIVDIELKLWRSQIGPVQQEPFLFNDTIFRNIEYGLIGTSLENISKDEKMELVKKACHDNFADEFIDRLPEGYYTMVGDGGAKLWRPTSTNCHCQEYHKNPKIIILDEATSTIDVCGKKFVKAALDRVSRNRTTITIAHRLSTITKADSIVALQKGQVVEFGTHLSLLQNESGVYRQLIAAQNCRLASILSMK